MEEKGEGGRNGEDRVYVSPMKQVLCTPRLSQSSYLSSVLAIIPESKESDCD